MQERHTKPQPQPTPAVASCCRSHSVCCQLLLQERRTKPQPQPQATPAAASSCGSILKRKKKDLTLQEHHRSNQHQLLPAVVAAILYVARTPYQSTVDMRRMMLLLTWGVAPSIAACAATHSARGFSSPRRSAEMRSLHGRVHVHHACVQA